MLFTNVINFVHYRVTQEYANATLYYFFKFVIQCTFCKYSSDLLFMQYSAKLQIKKAISFDISIYLLPSYLLQIKCKILQPR